MKRYITKFALASVFFLFLFSALNSEAQAQSPAKVKYFSIYSPANTQAGNFSLIWIPDYSSNSVQVKGFYLYQRKIVQNIYQDIKLAKFVLSNDLRDSIPTIAGYVLLSDNNGSTWRSSGNFNSYTSSTIDTLLASIYLQNLASQTTVNFFMTSYGDSTESQISNLVTVNQNHNSDTARVTFTSNPPTSTKKNELFTYDADATTNVNANIIYSLYNAPSGVTINSSTGLVQWTPTVSGNFSFYIKGSIIYNGNTYYSLQTLNLLVTNCANSATISGRVIDDTGNPISDGYTTVYIYSITDSSNNQAARYTAKVDSGYFSANVDEGGYKIYFPGTNYHVACWYENVSTQDSATIVYVNCGENKTLNTTTMHNYHVPHYYNVSGTVMDSNNHPIPYAIVRFMTQSSNAQNYYMTAYTNNLGVYTIKLNADYTYIAYATAIKDTTNNNVANYYVTQYYNMTEDVAQASVITLTGDKSGINFILSGPLTYSNSISGKVVDQDNVGLNSCYVVAYLINGANGHYYHTYHHVSTTTNYNGEYTLSNLYPGTYVIFVVTSNNSNTAGYYKSGDFVVSNWQNATTFDVSSTSIISNITIKSYKKQIVKGNAGVTGIVTESNGALKLNDNPQGAKAIAGAIISVLNSANKVVEYGFTDKDGKYSIGGFANGSYKIVCDRVGYIFANSNVNLTGVKDNSFVLVPMDFSDVTENIDIKGIYPNPSSNYLIINIENSNYKYKILNINGDELLNGKLISGSNKINIELLNVGSYIVVLENNNKFYSKVIIKQ
jgi:protocatechuate 3,4-dioxygenase beta subunit